MKAAVAHEFKKKLVIEDVKIPSIGVNDVLVNIKACGVCHTDIQLAKVTGRLSLKCLSFPVMKVLVL